jgi:hypothetical protein
MKFLPLRLKIPLRGGVPLADSWGQVLILEFIKKAVV